MYFIYIYTHTHTHIYSVYSVAVRWIYVNYMIQSELV